MDVHVTVLSAAMLLDWYRCVGCINEDCNFGSLYMGGNFKLKAFNRNATQNFVTCTSLQPNLDSTSFKNNEETQTQLLLHGSINIM